MGLLLSVAPVPSPFFFVFGGSYFNHVYLISAAVPVWPDAPESMVAKVDADGA